MTDEIESVLTHRTPDGKQHSSHEAAELWLRRIKWARNHVDEHHKFKDEGRREAAVKRLIEATECWDKELSGDASLGELEGGA